jgi:hypothetical protein
MEEKMSINKIKIACVAFVVGGLILTACGAGTPPTPTTDPNLIITQVAQTIEANLALTASAQPTETLTPEPTQVPTETPTLAVTPLVVGTPGISTLALPTVPGGGTGVSPDAMAFSADVTIPDNTQLSPSAAFTKTWRMKNTGTTTWNSNYQLVYWDGVPITEVEKVLPVKQVKLSSEVKPGAEGEVSVKMVAPSKNGTYKIWWRLLNPAGAVFGDSLYALIIVNDGTITLVPSVTPTKTP